MKKLELRLLEDVEAELNIDASLLEKDWYAVQLLKALVEWDGANGAVRPIFTGGTALSKAHGLISRFSEDIDICLEELKPLSRTQRSQIKHDFQTHLNTMGWDYSPPKARNENRYIGLELTYPISQKQAWLRPYLQLELIYKRPRLPLIKKPVSSFVGQVLGAPPEIANIDCLAIAEICAEKISALCWRLEDPKQPDRISLVRHLHDIACLFTTLQQDDIFRDLVIETLQSDITQRSPHDPRGIFQRLQDLPTKVSIYGQAYETYVVNTQYRPEVSTAPNFSEALSILQELVNGIVSNRNH
jgi:predicted nucleotidyltransferase component of viral defense system